MHNASRPTPEVIVYFCAVLFVLSASAGARETRDVPSESAALDVAGIGDVPVDLELVIASDVSTSMDIEEKRLQRDGFVAAFRSPEVQRAISRGARRRIAVVYVEWGSVDRQRVVVPWTLIDGPASAYAFADRLAETFPGRLAYGTALGNALAFGARLFDRNSYEGERWVIDVSGDGMSNRGEPLDVVRRDVLARGIVINGLPIVYHDAAEAVPFGGIGADEAAALTLVSNDELVAYFETQVIGGPGAFVVPVKSRAQYAQAIRDKLVREIAGTPAPARQARGVGGEPGIGREAGTGRAPDGQMSSVLSRSHWVRWRE